MTDMTFVEHIDAPVEKVWQVLDDFGEIQQWSKGVKFSALTSDGPVAEGATRHCKFEPFGGVNERIAGYEPHKRMTVHIYEAFKMPISEATADFNIEPANGGTQLTLHYSYTPNLFGRVLGPYTRKQMEQGIGGLARALKRESERVAQG